MLPSRSNARLDEQLQRSSTSTSQKNESIRQPTAKIQPQGQVLCLSRNDILCVRSYADEEKGESILYE
jgi:hypothetical protein